MKNYIKIKKDPYLERLSSLSSEGGSHSSEEQQENLGEIICSPSIINCAEVGFNSGSSANLFLGLNKKIKLTSFDIGEHECVSLAKNYIDNKYPFRHRLILGDSKKTVPQFHKENPNIKFDFIFIDGDHSYEGALADILNFQKMASDSSILVVDDIVSEPCSIGEDGHPCYWKWTIGPINAWKKCLGKQIQEISIENFSPKDGRGHAIGTYI